MATNRTSQSAALTAILAIALGASRVGAAEPARNTDTSLVSARRIVVSIPDRKLALIENDEVTVFAVAVGKPATPSPVGTFTIVNRVENPTYYKSGKTIGPGSTNPVGTRWIGLSQKGYGIHGTDNPKSIGYAKSHGCIRLRNSDVEQLFARVRPGDVVELHAERNEEIARIFSR